MTEPAKGFKPQTDDDLSAVRVWVVLWKAARAVEQNAARSIAELGLGLSDFAVLEMLLHKGPQPVNTIGKTILLTSGSITTAVDRLESRKLVRRLADPNDQRVRRVQLTEEGERLIQNAFEQHAQDLEKVMAVLTAKERAQLIRLLKKVGLFAVGKLS